MEWSIDFESRDELRCSQSESIGIRHVEDCYGYTLPWPLPQRGRGIWLRWSNLSFNTPQQSAVVFDAAVAMREDSFFVGLAGVQVATVDEQFIA